MNNIGAAHPHFLNSDLGHTLTPASENSDKNSDHDATANVSQQQGGEVAKDHNLTKQRRQPPKRLEVMSAATMNFLPMPFVFSSPAPPPSLCPQADKVAKKPKPAVAPPSPPPHVPDEDKVEKEEQKGRKAADGAKKSFEFVGDVLYNVCAAAFDGRVAFIVNDHFAEARATLLQPRCAGWSFGDHHHWRRLLVRFLALVLHPGVVHC